jgi:hypothetical protein
VTGMHQPGHQLRADEAAASEHTDVHPVPFPRRGARGPSF